MEDTAAQIAAGKTTDERIVYLEEKVFELIDAVNALLGTVTLLVEHNNAIHEAFNKQDASASLQGN